MHPFALRRHGGARELRKRLLESPNGPISARLASSASRTSHSQQRRRHRARCRAGRRGGVCKPRSRRQTLARAAAQFLSDGRLHQDRHHALRRAAARAARAGVVLLGAALLRRRHLLDDALAQGLGVRDARRPRVPAAGEDALALRRDRRPLRVQQGRRPRRAQPPLRRHLRLVLARLRRDRRLPQVDVVRAVRRRRRAAAAEPRAAARLGPLLCDRIVRLLGRLAVLAVDQLDRRPQGGEGAVRHHRRRRPDRRHRRLHARRRLEHLRCASARNSSARNSSARNSSERRRRPPPRSQASPSCTPSAACSRSSRR